MARSGIALHHLKSYREECGLTQRQLGAETLHPSKGKMVPLDPRRIAGYEGLEGESTSGPEVESGKHRILAPVTVASALAQTLQKHLRKRLADPSIILTVHDLANVPAAERLREWEQQRREARIKRW